MSENLLNGGVDPFSETPIEIETKKQNGEYQDLTTTTIPTILKEEKIKKKGERERKQRQENGIEEEEEEEEEDDDDEVITTNNTEDEEEEEEEDTEYAEPLKPEKVRWFYREGVDKRWTEFCGYDSLRIENIWRRRKSSSSPPPPSSNDNTTNNSNSEDANIERVVVRGGMYDVELDNMKCVSIYWPGEEWEIMRGTWFYDGSWIPLEPDHSQVIEETHLTLFQKSSPTQSNSTSAASTPSHSYKVLHTKNFTEFHVDWHAVDDVALYSENTPSKLMRSVTLKLGFTKKFLGNVRKKVVSTVHRRCYRPSLPRGKPVYRKGPSATGYRLRRGYKNSAIMEDKPNDIDHLVFVVHGIGQKRDTGKIIRNTTSFRECVDWLKHKYFPNITHRAEFFPVEWRSSLKLDGDIVDAITPYSVLSIRQILNTSAMDILYYTSPLYGGEVRAGLQKELNRLYFMFASRHPNWKGKVSILAHSLGCVIVYDIVTGWMGPDISPMTPAAQEISPDGLQFPIENLFCLGSPLSVFLALRTRAPSNSIGVMPQDLCKRFYNIFHWSDPIAYRMEPLLERGYSRVEPVLIPSYGGVDGQQYEQSPSSSTTVDPSLPPTGDIDEREESSPVDTPSSRNTEKSWSLWGLVRGGWSGKDDSTLSTPDMNPPLHPDQELKPRLDYVLRAVGLGRNYLYTVTAHTAYWSNYDVAYFVLTKLFPTLET